MLLAEVPPKTFPFFLGNLFSIETSLALTLKILDSPRLSGWFRVILLPL